MNAAWSHFSFAIHAVMNTSWAHPLKNAPQHSRVPKTHGVYLFCKEEAWTYGLIFNREKNKKIMGWHLSILSCRRRLAFHGFLRHTLSAVNMFRHMLKDIWLSECANTHRLVVHARLLIRAGTCTHTLHSLYRRMNKDAHACIHTISSWGTRRHGFSSRHRQQNEDTQHSSWEVPTNAQLSTHMQMNAQH
jgi:hypothetical protein